MNADNRLIVALDVSTMEQVHGLAGQLGDAVSYYKVGMELFYAVGKGVVIYLREQGKGVFLDLKLHDIPNTVAASLRNLTALGPSMLNVHAVGGLAMMKAAREAVAAAATEFAVERPKLLAVTVLTSIGGEDWAQLNCRQSIAEQVVDLALLAKKAGLDGVVASPQEAAAIRQVCGREFLIVTPGVRPAGAAINDQHRIATPAGALQSGASHLVIGRPITAAADQRAAAQAIIQEMRGI